MCVLLVVSLCFNILILLRSQRWSADRPTDQPTTRLLELLSGQQKKNSVNKTSLTPEINRYERQQRRLRQLLRGRDAEHDEPRPDPARRQQRPRQAGQDREE